MVIACSIIFAIFFAALNWLLGALLPYHPIKYKVVFIAHTIEQVFEKLAQVANIGLFFELERSAVVQIDGKLFRKSLSQRFNRG